MFKQCELDHMSVFVKFNKCTMEELLKLLTSNIFAIFLPLNEPKLKQSWYTVGIIKESCSTYF